MYMQLLLQFYSNCFETLHVFRSWSEDVCILFGYNPQMIFFSQIEFSRPLGVYTFKL